MTRALVLIVAAVGSVHDAALAVPLTEKTALEFPQPVSRGLSDGRVNGLMLAQTPGGDDVGGGEGEGEGGGEGEGEGDREGEGEGDREGEGEGDREGEGDGEGEGEGGGQPENEPQPGNPAGPPELGRDEPTHPLAPTQVSARELQALAQCDNILKRVVSSDAVARCYAAFALASLTTNVASDALQNMERWLIEARDPRETRESLEALAKVSEFLTEALPALVDARADWDPPAREAARTALMAIEEYAGRTVDLLHERGLARHPDPQIARRSIQVLGNLGMHIYGRERAHDVLADALDHPDLGVRYHAARGVLQIDEQVEAVAEAVARGDLDGEDDIQQLAIALQESPAFEESAVAALGTIGSEAATKKDELIRTLNAGDAVQKAQTVEELGEVDLFVTGSLPVLVEAPPILQKIAAGEAPPDLYAMLTVPTLIEALDDHDTVYVTAESLGHVGGAASTASADLAYIKSAAGAREAQVVADDVLTTISGRSDEAVAALLATFKEPQQFTNGAAVWGLGHLGRQASSDRRTSATSTLVDVLKRGSPDVQSEAAAALGLIKGDPKHIRPALAEALEAEDSAVRCEAARALGRLGDPAAVADLRRALQQDDLWLQYNAALALRQIDRSSDAGADDLQNVLQAIDDQSGDAIDTLVKAVRAGDAEAARTLQHLGAPATAAVPPLLELLRKAEPDDRDQIAQLVRTAGTSSLPEIRAAIHDLENDVDPTVRARAAVTLGQIGAGPRTVLPKLIEELRASDLPAHPEGVQALSELGTTTAAAIDALLVKALADDVGDVRQAARASLRLYALAAAREFQVAGR